MTKASENEYQVGEQVFLDFGVGFLGARCETPALAQGARDREIERRILRIEMALRRAGIEVESIEMPRTVA